MKYHKQKIILTILYKKLVFIKIQNLTTEQGIKYFMCEYKILSQENVACLATSLPLVKIVGY